MSRRSPSLESIPAPARESLRKLGENLAIARVRRRESQRAWGKRLGVSVPTVVRMERGDPGVAAGIFATALWIMGRAGSLAEAADPANDRGALEMDVREAAHRRAVRSAASAEARLGRKKKRGR